MPSDIYFEVSIRRRGWDIPLYRHIWPLAEGEMTAVFLDRQEVIDALAGLVLRGYKLTLDCSTADTILEKALDA